MIWKHPCPLTHTITGTFPDGRSVGWLLARKNSCRPFRDRYSFEYDSSNLLDDWTCTDTSDCCMLFEFRRRHNLSHRTVAVLGKSSFPRSLSGEVKPSISFHSRIILSRRAVWGKRFVESLRRQSSLTWLKRRHLVLSVRTNTWL